MKTTTWILATLLATGCTTVRQLRDPTTIPTTGVAEKTRTDNALDYSVSIPIAAPPEVIWAVLTDGPSFTKWNSTVIKLDGTIALGSEIQLTSIDKPDKTFSLHVTTFDAPKHMVWEDGGSMFLGVRHFTLRPGSDGLTIFVMSETLSGGMLGMIEGSLPDFTKSFNGFAADLKKTAEARASVR
jgi:uncharacterized protein YndB with AHSA1/START domain